MAIVMRISRAPVRPGLLAVAMGMDSQVEAPDLVDIVYRVEDIVR